MKSTRRSAVSRKANARSESLGRVRWRADFFSVTLLAATLSGCAITPMHGAYPDSPTAVYVQTPPPAPLHEVVGPPPGPGFVWVSGYWFWSGAKYVWASGHWLVMRPEHVWVQPIWQRSSRGWWLQEGGWQRQAAPAYPRGYAEPYGPPQRIPPPRHWSDDDRQPRAPREDGRRFMPMPAPAQPPAAAQPIPAPRQVLPESPPNRPVQRSERPAPPPPERGQDTQDADDRGKPIPGRPGWKRNRGQEAQ